MSANEVEVDDDATKPDASFDGLTRLAVGVGARYNF